MILISFLLAACWLFFERANILIDVFVPYGGDVYQLTNLFTYSRKKYFPYSALMRYIMKYQRRAIQRARVIVSFARHDLKIQDAIVNMGRAWIDWNMPMIYPIACPETSPQWDFLNDHDFIFFSHMRQTWKTGTDNNGNDKTIRGYAKFIKSFSHYKNPVLVLFEYGCDVDASKKLISQLGIENQVKWVPAMQSRHIYAGLKKAHVVAGIFNDEVISFGGVSYEAFSMSVPVIGYAKTKRGQDTHDLPLIHAFEVDEIAQALKNYQDNPAKFKEIGQQSKIWFDKNVGQGLIDHYLNLINLLIEHKGAKLEDKSLQHLAYSQAV